MRLPLTLGPLASDDLARAFAWYNKESHEVAREFMAEIVRTLGHIEWFPTGYQRIDGDVRRAVARRFQFGIFYRVHAAEIYVVAILSNRDDPRYAQQRITGH